jgi:hypothetical protein
VGTASSKEDALIGKEARPWRELRGWLLRSAREPDPWRLGSGRTTEGKGAGQSGHERLGSYNPMVGHPNGTGEIAEVVELAPTESATSTAINGRKTAP